MKRRSIGTGLVVTFSLIVLGCGGGSSNGHNGGAGSSGNGGLTGVGGKGGAGQSNGGSPGKGGAGQPSGGSPGTAGAGGGAHGGAVGAGGAVGPGGAGGSSTGAGGAGSGNLAKNCAADTDCGTGLICLKATDKLTFGTQGPAHGYCTIPCAEATFDVDEAKCEGLGGTCINLALTDSDPVQGFCLSNCTPGDVADQSSKCQGRPDVGCSGLTDSMGNAAGAACIPLCALDTDCPAGRVCDIRTGSCADAARTGDKMGAHCTADMTTGASACAGVCLPLGDGTGTTVVASICSQPCVIGAPTACNLALGATTSLATGGPHGACVYGDTNAGVGDMGFCAPECDATADCPDKVDMAMCDLTEMPTLGHGLCSFP